MVGFTQHSPSMFWIRNLIWLSSLSMAPPSAEVSQETTLRNRTPRKSALSVSQSHLNSFKIYSISKIHLLNVSGSVNLPAGTLIVVVVCALSSQQKDTNLTWPCWLPLLSPKVSELTGDGNFSHLAEKKGAIEVQLLCKVWYCNNKVGLR